MELLQEINAEKGVTILISSHVLEELEDLANRITLIHRGQTVAEGNPAIGYGVFCISIPMRFSFTQHQST